MEHQTNMEHPGDILESLDEDEVTVPSREEDFIHLIPWEGLDDQGRIDESLAIRVNFAAAKKLSNVLDAFTFKEPGKRVVPMPLIDAHSMRKIADYIHHHHRNDPGTNPDGNIPRPLGTSQSIDDLVTAGHISEWDAEFINIDDLHTLYALAECANYLNIDPLLELTCAKVASVFRGKSREDLIDTIIDIDIDDASEREHLHRVTLGAIRHGSHEMLTHVLNKYKDEIRKNIRTYIQAAQQSIQAAQPSTYQNRKQIVETLEELHRRAL